MNAPLTIVLYVYGEPREASPLFATLTKLAEELPGEARVEFVDVRADIARAEKDDVFATPTIDMVLDGESRRIVGIPAEMEAVPKQVHAALKYLHTHQGREAG